MQELKSPLLLVVEITGRCNLTCSYCYAKFGCRNKKDLGRDIFINIIDEAAKVGVFDVNICGGEPFLHGDIVEFIEYIKSKSIGVSLNTNGTLIDHSLARRLSSTSIIQDIQVSIDSHIPEIHNTSRGEFERTFIGFKNLCDASTKDFAPSVGCVINRHNFRFLPDTIRFFAEYTNRFHLMNVMGSKDLTLSIDEKKIFEAEIIPELLALSSQLNLKISNFTKDCTTDFALKKAHIDCLAGYTFLVISSSQDIMPCDIARVSIGKYLQYGDIEKYYIQLKQSWKERNTPWCANFE